MIINSRSRVSNLLFSNSCINWPKATRATPGLLATTRKASLWVRRAGIPIASPSSRARSGDTIGTRKLIVYPPSFPRLCYRASRPGRRRCDRGRHSWLRGHSLCRAIGAPMQETLVRSVGGETRLPSRIPADLPRFDRPPRGNPFMDAAGQKTRVNALGAQYRRGGLADLMAIDAIDDDRLLRQRRRPFGDFLGIAPRRARDARL